MSSVKFIISGTVGSKSYNNTYLWSIQPIYVWHSLIKNKSLKVNPKYVSEEFKDAYDWMVSQMNLRINGYSGSYPWWAFERRPNLRYQEEQGLHVLLQINMNHDRYLLSSYGSWHCVLNDWAFIDPRLIDDDVTNDFSGTQEQKKDSWKNIFNVDYLRSYDSIQATFEELRLDDIYRYTLFEVR